MNPPEQEKTLFRKYWWIFLGIISAVSLSTALNISNTDGWIVVTNSSNESWIINWNTTRPAICTVGNYSRWTGTGFVCAPDQTGSGGFVYSDYFNQNLNTTNSPTFVEVNTAGLQATSSAGLIVQSQSGINVVDFGTGNTNNTNFYGSVVIASGQNLCLSGNCRSTWPADTYTNVTALQASNATTNARIDNLNSTKLNATDQRYNDTAAINAVSTFAQTKAATGSVDCGAGNFLRVLTISNGSWTTTCAADSTGSGVTNVSTGNGLTGGPITSTGTISINSPTCGASEYLRWTGTAFVCSTPAGGGGSGFTPYNANYYFQDYDFESVTAAYTNIWVPTAIGAGTTAVIAGEANRPGLVTISSSATASSGYSYQLANAAAYLLRNGSGTKTIVAPITKTGNVTICRFGYQDSFTTTLPTDGLFWNVTQSASGSAVYNFSGVARNNNAQTNTSVFQYTTTTTQYFNLQTHVVNTTLAQFTIVNSTNGAILAGPINVTTNIPTATGRETSHANLCYVNGATTAQVLARIDYTSVYNNATTFTR